MKIKDLGADAVEGDTIEVKITKAEQGKISGDCIEVIKSDAQMLTEEETFLHNLYESYQQIGEEEVKLLAQA